MGETQQAQRLPDAPGGRAAGGLVARFSLTAFLADERGATAVEYGLIVCCIFLAIVGGLSLFADRPLWGYGSGSFSAEYEAHHRAVGSTLSASHTIPVTIAAEQGLIGELVYVALVACAIACLVRGARGDPVRSAVAAAFVALIFHTMLYADFLEDPATWALLAIGVVLAGAGGAAARRGGAAARGRGAGGEAELGAARAAVG